MIYFYKTISLTFFIANILSSALITIIIIFGFALVIISFPLFQISKVIGIAYKVTINMLITLVEITSKIPFSVIYVKTPYLYQIVLYYILIFSLKWLRNKKQIIVIILIIILIPNLIQIIPTNNLKIYLIDVGQGDSTLIKTPHKKNILIDGGGSESYNVRRKSCCSIFTKQENNKD